MRKVVLPMLFVLCCHCVSAQTYLFNGNGNWSDPSNWQNNAIPPNPVPGNSIINIQPATGGQCLLNIPVTIPVTVTLNVLPGSQFVIMGNLVVLSGNNYGTRLKKELQLFENSGGGYDTVAALIYYYDSLDRLAITIDCYFDEDTHDTTDNRYFRYYYHGNDTLPFKRSLTYYPDSDYYSDTTFYGFYPDGRRMYDSTLSYTNVPPPVRISRTERRYSYNGDSTRLYYERYTNNILQDLGTFYSYQSYNNGNVVYEYNSSGTGSNDSTVTHISHLADADPLYRKRRCGVKGFLESEITSWKEQDAPKNLINRWHRAVTSHNSQGTTVIEDDILISYNLRSDGYPVEAIITSIDTYRGTTTSTEVYKVLFIYE